MAKKLNVNGSNPVFDTRSKEKFLRKIEMLNAAN